MKDTGENDNHTVLDFEIQDENGLKDENEVSLEPCTDCDTDAENLAEDIILQSLATIISDIYFESLCSTKKKTKQ